MHFLALLLSAFTYNQILLKNFLVYIYFSLLVKKVTISNNKKKKKKVVCSITSQRFRTCSVFVFFFFLFFSIDTKDPVVTESIGTNYCHMDFAVLTYYVNSLHYIDLSESYSCTRDTRIVWGTQNNQYLEPSTFEVDICLTLIFPM